MQFKVDFVLIKFILACFYHTCLGFVSVGNRYLIPRKSILGFHYIKFVSDAVNFQIKNSFIELKRYNIKMYRKIKCFMV